MKKVNRHQHLLMLVLTALLAVGTLPAHGQTDFNANRTDFRDESIYFMITTRFYDGDPHNNVLCWDNQTCQIETGDPCWRGDFAGVIDKLDYIKALGFTAIWITPIVQNASGYDYHGYHAMDFSHVDLRYESHTGKGKYGGSDRDVDFQTLIDAAHAKGIKIILDIVLNHTGNFGEERLCKEFDRSQNILNQADINACMLPTSILPSDYLDNEKTQYQRRLALMKNTDGQNHDTNNYWHHVGSGWNWDEPSRWWGQIAGDCVDLNTENPAVAQYLVDCYGSFIKMGVDGFRIDTSGHISRLTFNSFYIPKFKELGEKYKSKRLNQAPFFMYGEVCARYGGVTYRDHANLSPYYYTWASDANLVSSWQSVTAADWAGVEVKEGADPLLNMVTCGSEADVAQESNNTFMVNGAYHTPDYSKSSGFNVIDFPVHYNFTSASSAFGMASGGDKYYNDATYNVVYVDSHDYGPQPSDGIRFSGSDAQWAENLSLMFTFRGIPCIYYGSEIGFRRGATIDNGPNGPLSTTGRAYFGGYITGDVTASDFGSYTASGNAAATLSHDLAQHLIRLNKIRQACPALRRGQWTSDGCSANGGIAFKRATADSYALVCLNGGATFTGCPDGTYTDLVTGQTYSGSTITVSAPSNQGQLRVLVRNYTGKSGAALLGGDGKFIYSSASASCASTSYDGNEEAGTEYYITKDDAIGEAGMSFSPNGGEFISDTKTVSVSLNEVTSGWYQINGGSKVNVTENTTFTIGSGDATGTVYTINWGVTLEDGSEKTGTLTFTKQEAYIPSITSSNEISVFYETSASTVGIWVWDATNATNYTGGEWASKPNMEKMGVSESGNNIFKWTYDGTLTAIPEKVIFLPGGVQSKDLTYTNHGYYVDNVCQETITNINGQAQKPSISFSQPSGTKFSSSLDVTITAKNATSATYSINNGSAVSFDGSTTITLTETSSVSVTASGEGGQATASATYTLAEPSKGHTIYFQNTGNWSNIYLWAWDKNQKNVISGTSWPGLKITDQTADGYYYYTFADGSEPTGGIIWNDGNGTKAGNADLTYTENMIYNLNGASGTIYGGTVIVPGTAGDINGDDIIDVTDYATLVNILNGKITMPSTGTEAFTGADANKDGKITSDDLKALRQLIHDSFSNK